MAKECRQRGVSKWCNYHRSTTHSDETCRRKTKHKDEAKQTTDGQKDQKEEQTFVFKVSQKFLPDNIKSNGLMVDCGATSHIITEEDAFTKFDETFNPNAHYMELADGTRMSNVALKRGDAEVCLQDREGRCSKVTLRKALFIPSYPQSILSVKAATTNGATVTFQEGQNELIHKDGTVFRIEVHERLYYLKTVNNKQCVKNTVNDVMSTDSEFIV